MIVRQINPRLAGPNAFPMKPLILLTAALCLSLTARPQPPNILFIAVDDLNDWIGCLGGHPQTITPNFDRLAASGVLFTNAHCPATACNPSRSAIMTGISPATSGLYSNRQIMREIMPDTDILPQHFRKQGYRAMGSGKMLHYFTDAGSWDEYFPPKKTENPIPETLYPEKRPLSLPRGGPWQYIETDWGPLETSDEKFGGDFKVTEYVGEQLSKEHAQPFFLACGIYRPHEPWFVPAKYFEPFPLENIQLPPGYRKDDLDDLPPAAKRYADDRYFNHIEKEGQWKKGIQGYLASIHFADAMLGRVLKALDQGPNADNTIVVLWSDHGWQLGEKRRWQKFSGWRAVTRVPLMMRVPKGCSPALPAGTGAGSVCDQPVNLLSLHPTLISLAGVAKNPNCDGLDLLPLLEDASAPWPHLSTTFLGRRGSYTISGKRWRYLHYHNADEELYDIQNDPYEWSNLAGDPAHRETLERMRSHRPKTLAMPQEASFASLPSLIWQAGSTGIPDSKPDGGRFDLHFFNRRAHPVTVVSPAVGKQQEVRVEIAPGQKEKRQTRPGTVWRVIDPTGKILGHFKVGDRKAKAIIPPKK
jgi:arylsulfatase A-like enzyme